MNDVAEVILYVLAGIAAVGIGTLVGVAIVSWLFDPWRGF